VNTLTLIVVAKGEADMRAFDLSHAAGCDVALVSNEWRRPLSVIGNTYMDTAHTPVIGLVHADCLFGPGALDAFTAAALSGAVCGIVGVSVPDLVYHWCGINPGPVSTLDSCAVFFRRDLGLRFDEPVYNSFHCHVEDLCLQAHARNIPVIVPAAEATHRSETANGEAWLNEYQTYRQRLCRKWPGVEFATT
jgi:hypothetical protein